MKEVEDIIPNWDWKGLGFESEEEFVQYILFQRQGNPNYDGIERNGYEYGRVDETF